MIVVAIVLSLVAGSGAMATQLYNQNFDGLGNFYSSQNDTGGGNGNFATVYDNFSLGAASNINNVTFVGAYFNPPAQGTITAFTISFWSNAAGQPGGLLQSFSIGGTGSETSIGSFGGFPTFSYSVNLGGMGFNAMAGTQYWISIVPDVAFPPQWGWGTSADGDGVAYQDFFGARSQLSSDLAFSLNGTTGVPDSGNTVLLMGGALVVFGLLRRRIGVAS